MKTNNGVDYLREKLIDYYGSATPFFAVAHADVVRIEHMSDDEIIEEAGNLNLI
jgi:hypothetical protein